MADTTAVYGTTSWLNETVTDYTTTEVIGLESTYAIDLVYKIETIFLSLIFLLGAPGNGIVILVQKHNLAKSSTDYLVLSMAIFEFWCSTVNVIMHMIRNPNLLHDYVVSTPFCRMYVYISYISSLSSSLLIASIAIDRYIRTCHPLNTFYTTRAAKYICVGIAVACIVMASPAILIFAYKSPRHTCVPRDDVNAMLVKIWNAILSSIAGFVLIILVFSYTKISILLRRRHNKRVNSRGKGGWQIASSAIHVEDTDSQLPATSVTDVKCEEKTAIPDKAGDVTDVKYEEKTAVHGNYVITATKQNETMASEGKTTSNDAKSDVKGDPPTFTKEYEVLANERKPTTLDNADDPAMDSTGNANTVANTHDGNGNMPTTTKDEAVDDERLTEEAAGIFGAAVTVMRAGVKPQLDKLARNEQAMNRTTRIMFIISLIYMVSWIGGISVMMSGYSLGVIASKIGYMTVMLNCITNPITYAAMSSSFRARAAKVLCRR